MPIIRLIKTALVAAVALFFTLVAFGFLTFISAALIVLIIPEPSETRGTRSLE